MFIFKGLVEKVESDDELASVIAHEIAHIVARHSVKRLQGGLGYNILQVLMVVSGQGARDTANINNALGQLMMSYSREDEAVAEAAVAVAAYGTPYFEQWLFDGDFTQWLYTSFGSRFDHVGLDDPSSWSCSFDHAHLQSLLFGQFPGSWRNELISFLI